MNEFELINSNGNSETVNVPMNDNAGAIVPVKRTDPKTLILRKLKEDPSYIQKIPEARRTNDIVNFVLAIRPDALQYLEVREQTLERCLKCVSKNGLLLDHVKDQTDKFEVICKAIEQNYEALQFVHHQTFDLCEQVIKVRPDAIRFVKLCDTQLYYLAVHLDPTNIRYVPAQYQTEDIKKLASDRQVNLDHISNPTPETLATVFNSDRGAVDNIDAISQKYPFLKIEFDNTILKISYNDNIKVLIYETQQKRYYYTNYTKDLLGMVFAYIRTNSGDRGLTAAKDLFSKNKSDPKLVEKDPIFVSGLFIIENNDKNYELWEKTVEEQYSQSTISWMIYGEYTTVAKKVKLLRTYQLMEMAFQEFV